MKILPPSFVVLFWIWSICFSNLSYSQVPTASPYKAKHHIILVLDGPRWSETWGDSTGKHIPHQMFEMRQLGTFFTDFRNGGKTLTNSGHTALLTGVHQKISNLGKELPKYPGLFQYARKELNLPKEKVWLLTSKGKLQMLDNTKHKEWWNTYLPSSHCGINASGKGYPNDNLMYPEFKKIILEHNPTFTLINLIGIDAWAHQNNWERYIQSIEELDAMVLDLWIAIQADPEMKNQTALYITNDHGRHLDGHKNGFISHGCKCDGCSHISLLAIGPDFTPGKTINQTYDQVDLTATIAKMLGIHMPFAKGKPITELLTRQVKE